MHGDDAHYGSVQHVELFAPWPTHPRVNDVVGVMNNAATTDATGVLVWPVIRAMLSRGKAPDAGTASAVGAHRQLGAPRSAHARHSAWRADPVRRRGAC